jgi:hypothetical protein
MTYKYEGSGRVNYLIKEFIDNDLSEYIEQVSDQEINVTMPPANTNQYSSVIDIVNVYIGFENLVPIKS